jgi:hypothetical protein
MRRHWGRAAGAAGLIGVLALGGCSSTSSGGSGGTVSDMLISGTAAPPRATVGVGDPYCPRVGVIDGGGTLEVQGSVASLGDLARECSERPDGSVVVKIGVQGRVVLGGRVAGGRFDVPVRFVVSDGAGNVIASRVQRTAVAIPAGEGNALFAVVEEGIVVPAAAAEAYDIEIGLGAGAPPAARRRRG